MSGGVKTVPVEPTEEMWAAASKAAWDEGTEGLTLVQRVWSAMLAASPSPRDKAGEGQ